MKERGCLVRNDKVVLDKRKSVWFKVGERVYVDGDISMGHPVKDTSAIVLEYTQEKDVNRLRMVKVYLRQSRRLLTVSPDWVRRWR